MTIATLMATCLVFVGLGWTGDVYQPMALCVGAIVCIAAANAGATSQDLKTGFLVGATPRAQQIGLLIGVMTATLVVGFTIRVLDDATVDRPRAPRHLIGTDMYPAPQATLMATLIKGLLALNLDWQFVMVGVALAVDRRAVRRRLALLRGRRLPAAVHDPPHLLRRHGEAPGLSHEREEARSLSAPTRSPRSGGLFATGLVARRHAARGGRPPGAAPALPT